MARTIAARAEIDLGNGDVLDSEDDIVADLVKAGFDLADHHRLEASFQRFDNQAKEPLNGQSFASDDLTEKHARTDTTRIVEGFEVVQHVK